MCISRFELRFDVDATFLRLANAKARYRSSMGWVYLPRPTPTVDGASQKLSQPDLQPLDPSYYCQRLFVSFSRHVTEASRSMEPQGEDTSHVCPGRTASFLNPKAATALTPSPATLIIRRKKDSQLHIIYAIRSILCRSRQSHSPHYRIPPFSRAARILSRTRPTASASHKALPSPPLPVPVFQRVASSCTIVSLARLSIPSTPKPIPQSIVLRLFTPVKVLETTRIGRAADKSTTFFSSSECGRNSTHKRPAPSPSKNAKPAPMNGQKKKK
jgi:hypothetical protein